MTEKQMRSEDLENDLADLALELKRNIGLIISSAVLCLALAAGWSFFTDKPMYTARGLICLPGDIDAWQVNTCVEVLQADKTDGFALSDVRQLPNSFILSLSFRGESGAKVEEEVKAYLPTALKKVNDLLLEKKKADLQRALLKQLKTDLHALVVQNGGEKERQLAYIREKLESVEADKTFARAELLDGEPKVTEAVPDRKSSLIMGLVCGLFFGTLYVLLRYIIRRSYGEQKA